MSNKHKSMFRKTVSVAPEHQLFTLWECVLGRAPGRVRRNVPLYATAARLACLEIENCPSRIAYRVAHILERRSPDSKSGIWPISNSRALRLYGMVANRACDESVTFEGIPDSVWAAAKQMRLLCYSRVTTAPDAIRIVQSPYPLQIAIGINRDWDNPPQGRIPVSSKSAKFDKTHAVTLVRYVPEEQSFLIDNSFWGRDWGDCGFGHWPVRNWEQSLVAAWRLSDYGLHIPSDLEPGIILRGWKWGFTHDDAVYSVEIVDTSNDENLAWTYCIKRDGYLDVDEFFVRPECRQTGYAGHMAEHVAKLARTLNLKLRLVVSFADTEPHSIDGAHAVARLFKLVLNETNVPWASMLGTEHVTASEPRVWYPERPATSVLEWFNASKNLLAKEPVQVRLFFGTTREPIDSSNISMGFSNNRGERLIRGSCLVEIPTIPKKRGERILSTDELTSDQFKLYAKATIEKATGDKQNLLFIHGYQNNFRDAVVRAAKLGEDLRIQGATYLFSWPSAAKLLGYSADEATYESSIGACTQLVTEILTEFEDVPLHVFAHSLGTRLTLRLFDELATRPAVPGKIGQLILAASDVDVDVYKATIPRIAHLPVRITSYVSCADWPLTLSKWKHRYDRLGGGPQITTVEGADTVYVHGFDLFDGGHDYATERRYVLHDVHALIRHNTPPEQRIDIRQGSSETGAPFWTLPLSG